jgi:AcrR family transcriptional regulator
MASTKPPDVETRPVGRTNVRRALRRDAIIDAAIGLLAERGPDVTVAEIAAAAGTSEGTVFYAFTDRAELMARCIDRLLGDQATAAALDAAAVHGDPRDRLLAACVALRANMLAVVPIMLAALRSPSLGPGPSLDLFAPIERRIESVFGADDAWVAPATELAADVLGRLFGQVFRHVVGGVALPDLEQSVDMFLGGALGRS